MSHWTWIDWMAFVNACLISSSGIFILLGIRAIKQGDEQLHRRRMLTATALCALFLILYLTRIAMGGFTPFHGPVFWKWVYYLILFPHLILAMVQTPLVLIALYRAFKGEFAKHRQIARITAPIWVYVAFSGVFVFLMLRIPFGS
jgi:putative membrane protein